MNQKHYRISFGSTGATLKAESLTQDQVKYWNQQSHLTLIDSILDPEVQLKVPIQLQLKHHEEMGNIRSVTGPWFKHSTVCSIFEEITNTIIDAFSLTHLTQNQVKVIDEIQIRPASLIIEIEEEGEYFASVTTPYEFDRNRISVTAEHFRNDEGVITSIRYDNTEHNLQQDTSEQCFNAFIS
jgi:hypothetical protein